MKYCGMTPIPMTICEENRDKTESSIASIVANLGIKRSAEELLQRLKPIAVALDKVQRDNCTIADAVNIWKQLETDLPLEWCMYVKCEYHSTGEIQPRQQVVIATKVVFGISVPRKLKSVSLYDIVNYLAQRPP